ncbi:MAG: type II secretion system protein [Phycisphaerales bacterium]|nr:type II secretion system protein [Phycisphaerales bacterium]
MSLRSTNRGRHGFTLIEAVVAMIVLALAVPIGLSMMRDAAVARVGNAQTAKAFWLASAVTEQVMADLDSTDAALGFDALADASAYLNDAPDALRTRLASVVSDAEAAGFTWDVTAGALVDATGVTSGDTDEDIYRVVTISVSWTNTMGQAQNLPLSFMAANRKP